MSYPEELRTEIDEYLAAIEFDHSDFTAPLVEAMRYSLLAGGKRIRPVLSLATAQAVGVDPATVLPFAAATELIHTYSLIHDDLPAMDDDLLRRGMATCHVKFGEDIAILAGDALYAEAFNHVLSNQSGEPSDLVAAVRELAAASGVNGMVGGQYMDVTDRIGEGVAGLSELHGLKTGKLIQASVVGVLLVAGRPESETMRLREFARELGVLFQIVDDILDVTGDDVELGKPQGSDERHGKRTYVSEFGLERAREFASDSHSRALAELREVTEGNTDDLKSVADFIYTRTS